MKKVKLFLREKVIMGDFFSFRRYNGNILKLRNTQMTILCPAFKYLLTNGSLVYWQIIIIQKDYWSIFKLLDIWHWIMVESCLELIFFFFFFFFIFFGNNMPDEFSYTTIYIKMEYIYIYRPGFIFIYRKMKPNTKGRERYTYALKFSKNSWKHFSKQMNSLNRAIKKSFRWIL